jgi:hypothetical protein
VYRIFKYYKRFNYDICILDFDHTLKTKYVGFGNVIITLDSNNTIIDGIKNKIKYVKPAMPHLYNKIEQILDPLKYSNPQMINYINTTDSLNFPKELISIITVKSIYPVKFYPDICSCKVEDVMKKNNIKIYSFNETYKCLFSSIYIHHYQMAGRILRYIFSADLLKQFQRDKITLKAALFIVFQEMIKNSSKPTDFWIKTDPSNQFDMRFRPIDLTPDKFYQLS